MLGKPITQQLASAKPEAVLGAYRGGMVASHRGKRTKWALSPHNGPAAVRYVGCCCGRE